MTIASMVELASTGQAVGHSDVARLSRNSSAGINDLTSREGVDGVNRR
jgi:hypothetical protein